MKKCMLRLIVPALAIFLMACRGALAVDEVVTMIHETSNGTMVYDLYTFQDGTGFAVITRYFGSDALIEIPGTLGGVNVTGIDEQAFMNCVSVEKVDMSAATHLKTIGSGAFSHCTGLVSVTFPEDSLTTLASDAFADCVSLGSVELPDSLTAIPAYAFANCASLRDITLPAELESIGSYAFSGTGFESFVLPDAITAIPAYAFANCASLRDITLPAQLTGIGSGAFSGTAIESFTLPIMDAVPDRLFANCKSLKTVSLPEGVKVISQSAFSNSSITGIDIPSTVFSIDQSAFACCEKLTGITIPDSVVTIGYSAFSGCASLESVQLPAKLTQITHSCFADCGALRSIQIPEGVTAIESSAFSDCVSLERIDIPAMVTAIGTSAFKDCTALKAVSLPERLTSLGSGTAVGAFQGCESLESIIIPATLTTVGPYTFKNCSSLKTVAIGEGTTTLDNYAFDGCSGLEKVYLPRSVTAIGANTFPASYGAAGYYLYSDSRAYEIMNGLGRNFRFEFLDEADFADVGMIFMVDAIELMVGDWITIEPEYYPAGTYTGTWTSSDDSVASVYNGIVTAREAGTAVITLNVGGVTARTTVTVTAMEDVLVLPDKLEVIGTEALRGVSAKYVIVPDSVKAIGAYAFADCPDGMKVEILSSNEIDIDENAFSGSNVIVVCKYGSYVHNFVMDHTVSFEMI